MKKVVKRLKPDKYFYLCNGKVIKNIKELTKAIKNMPEDVFYFHVDEGKNDFANWIIDIMEKKKLGEDIIKAKEKDKTELLLLRYLYY